MPLGWTVVVYRRGAYDASEYWDCAIPSFIEAEKAVRGVCACESIAYVAAYQPVSAAGVRLMKLADGQVRRRNHGRCRGAAPVRPTKP